MSMETGGFGGDDRRRWLVPALIVAAVAIVLILILLIGKLISSRSGSSATATPARTPTRSAIIAATPSASRAVLPPIGTAGTSPNPSQSAPAPTATAQAAKFVVVATNGDVLNLRATPSTSGEILKKLADGTRLEDLGQTQDGNGVKWRKVKDPTDNTEGWVAQEFIAPATP